MSCKSVKEAYLFPYSRGNAAFSLPCALQLQCLLWVLRDDRACRAG